MIINLTPHDIVTINEDGTVRNTYVSQGIARAAQSFSEAGTIDGERIVETEFGEPVDLPEPKEGVYLVVSVVTAQAAAKHGRSTYDLLLTTLAVRNEKGQIIGCKALTPYRP